MTPRLQPVERVPGPEGGLEGWDALVVVTAAMPPRLPDALEGAIVAALQRDRVVADRVSLLLADTAPGGRLIVAPTGRLDREIDDVRRVAEAARAGVERARDAGSVRPLIVFRGLPREAGWEQAVPVGLLGALSGLWAPLEAREALGEEVAEPVEAVGFLVPEGEDGAGTAAYVTAVEAGRRLARDLTGTQPERMTPRRFAEHCREAFSGTEVEVEVTDDIDTLRADYPLLLAVARASLGVERHKPCVLRLEWEGEGPIHETVLLAGKGVTYDTGGADLKVGGHMAGMSRDKGGAAAVAGFVRTAAALRIKGLRIVAELGLVRNSVGSDAFVTDEILVSHAGVRVRVGNTDAEGRLVLADLLSHLREEAYAAVSPRVLSVATLTGHAGIAVGPYTIVMANGPAREEGLALDLAESGDRWGDPFEISRLRREDFDRVQPRSRADDVLSCNNAPSSQTPRGHQFPMAFLAIASGLSRHDIDADDPIPYLHVDLGGSGCEGGDWQHGRPTAAPVSAFAGCWLYEG